jgi:hypothetical protein
MKDPNIYTRGIPLPMHLMYNYPYPLYYRNGGKKHTKSKKNKSKQSKKSMKPDKSKKQQKKNAKKE